MFCGKPIIAYSIKAAQESGCFDRIIVSTDDAEIAQTSKEYGAEVPFIRPNELANDHATTGVVIEHALDFLAQNGERPDYVCSLYATAPFIQASALRNAYLRLESAPKKSTCFSVTEFSFPIQRAIKISNTGRVKMVQPEHFNTRSQDLETTYHDAGQFSWTALKRIFSDDTPWGKYSIAHILPSYLVQDIDTPDDWVRAEAMYMALQNQPGILS